MALAFTVKNVISKGLGGRKIRLVNITLDALYVNGTGWSVTPANLKLKTKVEKLLLGNVNGFMLKTNNSGNNGIIRAYRTGTAVSGALEEAPTNLAGLDTLVAEGIAVGY